MIEQPADAGGAGDDLRWIEAQLDADAVWIARLASSAGDRDALFALAGISEEAP